MSTNMKALRRIKKALGILRELIAAAAAATTTTTTVVAIRDAFGSKNESTTVATATVLYDSAVFCSRKRSVYAANEMMVQVKASHRD